MKTWQFEYAQRADGSGTWQWICICPDGTRLVSERRFVVFRECEADAENHGYLKHTGS